MTDRHPAVRCAVAGALGQVGTTAAIMALLEAASDADRVVRKQIARALRRIGSKAGPAVLALVRVLEDGDRDVRRLAERALGSIGSLCV
jgi:HEAT repeat protein